jgi:hypothetical protein
MMYRLTKVACGAAALALVLGVTTETRAGKPDKPGGKPGNDQPKTQACILTEDGDATGGGEVGVDAKSYGPLTMTVVAEPTGCDPDGETNTCNLADVFTPLGTDEPYDGLGRVLKRDGRLDFDFNLDGSTCRPIEWGEEPGPDLDPAVCRYNLLLMNGVYDRKSDSVEFGSGTTAQLFDWRAAPGSVRIGHGSARLLVQFQ